MFTVSTWITGQTIAFLDELDDAELTAREHAADQGCKVFVFSDELGGIVSLFDAYTGNRLTDFLPFFSDEEAAERDAYLRSLPENRVSFTCEHGVCSLDGLECVACDQQRFLDEQQGEREAENAWLRYSENRWDEDTQRDLDLHDSLWPNGYGYCPQGCCRLEVYHPGACDERTVEEREAEELIRRCFPAGTEDFFKQATKTLLRIRAEVEDPWEGLVD